jgi:hypothetical protein
VRRSGRGKFIALLLIVLCLIAGWTGLWFYAAKVAQETMAGWRAREAKAGRIHTCASESLGGFPFRIEFTCGTSASEFRSLNPPMQLTMADIHAAVQIYDPTLLIAEINGPLTIGDRGAAPSFSANWNLAQASLRGTPSAPERLAVVLDKPVLNRLGAGIPAPVAQAARMEFHGRIAEGSARDNPVIETVIRLNDAALPFWSALAEAPVTSETTAVLRGLKDFSPKPWAARFREIQADNGSIEITQMRATQGEALAVGSGTLKLNAAGRVEGRLQLTVVGLEGFLKKIGIENAAPVDRLAGTLDRLLPGLGAVARSQAGAGIAAGVNLIGEPTTLEGRKAVSVPLRFVDGVMMLGPIQVGQVPPLF